ncbi:MAG: glycosyltransferase family A protein [Gemmatimonadota bacterium]
MPRPADVSVVIPVHNGVRFIREAVRSAQGQSRAPAEIIVVDDGSTDGTADVVRALPGVTYVRQENAGPASARNHGVRLATRAFLAFLDADDLWSVDKTALQLALFEKEPEMDVVVGHSQRVILIAWREGEPQYETVGNPIFYLHLGSSLFRRASFDRVGAFDERMRMGEDVDWFLRAKETGMRMRFHDDVVQPYQKHDANVTLDREEMNRWLVRSFKHSLDRRRAASTDTPASLGDWSSETLLLRKRRE